MCDEIKILKKPTHITYDDIHKLLHEAHKGNADAGFHVKTAEMDADALERLIGENGECYVALDGDKLVGVTAVRIVSRNSKLAIGKVADQILVAISPEYVGRHISTLLHEKVVTFAKEQRLNQIEVRTAANNTKMQCACKKWGFIPVDFQAYRNLDHYTVVMMKWLDSISNNRFGIRMFYIAKTFYTRLRYKPGRVKRFGL